MNKNTGSGVTAANQFTNNQFGFFIFATFVMIIICVVVILIITSNAQKNRQLLNKAKKEKQLQPNNKNVTINQNNNYGKIHEDEIAEIKGIDEGQTTRYVLHTQSKVAQEEKKEMSLEKERIQDTIDTSTNIIEDNHTTKINQLIKEINANIDAAVLKKYPDSKILLQDELRKISLLTKIANAKENQELNEMKNKLLNAALEMNTNNNNNMTETFQSFVSGITLNDDIVCYKKPKCYFCTY